MAPLEPWEKVLISAAFLETVHGHIACTDCHQGEQSPDKETAHTGLIDRPSQDPEATCGDCHTNIASVHQGFFPWEQSLVFSVKFFKSGAVFGSKIPDFFFHNVE
ncbi:MAG: hypothetical protein R6X32_22250 [Chloroflexota bacterium]